MPGVPHVLIDVDDGLIGPAEFMPHIRWQPGETILLGAAQRYRVVERQDPPAGGATVTLIVERAAVP